LAGTLHGINSGCRVSIFFNHGEDLGKAEGEGRTLVLDEDGEVGIRRAGGARFLWDAHLLAAGGSGEFAQHEGIGENEFLMG
jgi:hypothetical protein